LGIDIRRKHLYPAIVSLEAGMFEARLVDFPNCVAVATTAEEAEVKAEGALRIWFEMAKRFSRPVPPPTPARLETCNRRDRYITYIRPPLGI
jgi:predicted RNase H-like HicB family nuclease